MVDLSKAKKGDKVKFRCGGEAGLEECEFSHAGTWPEIYRLTFTGGFKGSCYGKEGQACGNVGHPFDIISIEPAPFDWSTVKAGMAFYGPNNEPFYYVGTNTSGEFVFDWPKLSNTYRHSTCTDISVIRRAPEHDIEVTP